jgi:hypothetical protein
MTHVQAQKDRDTNSQREGRYSLIKRDRERETQQEMERKRGRERETEKERQRKRGRESNRKSETEKEK